MKSIIIIGAFIGILFSNSGIAMEILQRSNIDTEKMNITVLKVFDSDRNMMCYMIIDNTNETETIIRAMDCLKRTTDQAPQNYAMIVSYPVWITGKEEITQIVPDSPITKVMDSTEGTVCYITGSVKRTLLLDCEKI